MTTEQMRWAMEGNEATTAQQACGAIELVMDLLEMQALNAYTKRRPNAVIFLEACRRQVRRLLDEYGEEDEADGYP